MPTRRDAFISCSHAADGPLAAALESGLEKLAKSLFKLRALDVFRDQKSLTAALNEPVEYLDVTTCASSGHQRNGVVPGISAGSHVRLRNGAGERHPLVPIDAA